MNWFKVKSQGQSSSQRSDFDVWYLLVSWVHTILFYRVWKPVEHLSKDPSFFDLGYRSRSLWWEIAISLILVLAATLKNSFVHPVSDPLKSWPMGFPYASRLLGDTSQRSTLETVTKSQPCFTWFSIFVISSDIASKLARNILHEPLN